MSDPSLLEKARQAVEDKLKVGEFITSHQADIDNRLIAALHRTEAAESQTTDPEASLVFVGECLPFVSGIIHVGSDLHDFQEAKDWAKTLYPFIDPISVLSALTFLYLVDKGEQKTRERPNEHEPWHQMSERVCDLLKSPTGRSASAG